MIAENISLVQSAPVIRDNRGDVVNSPFVNGLAAFQRQALARFAAEDAKKEQAKADAAKADPDCRDLAKMMTKAERAEYDGYLADLDAAAASGMTRVEEEYV